MPKPTTEYIMIMLIILNQNLTLSRLLFYNDASMTILINKAGEPEYNPRKQPQCDYLLLSV